MQHPCRVCEKECDIWDMVDCVNFSEWRDWWEENQDELDGDDE